MAIITIADFNSLIVATGEHESILIFPVVVGYFTEIRVVSVSVACIYIHVCVLRRCTCGGQVYVCACVYDEISCSCSGEFGVV